MLEIFIRIFFLLITAIYTFYKLSNCRPANRIIQLMLLISSALICGFSTFISNLNQSLLLISVFCMFFLLMKFIEKHPITHTYITSLFSFSFSFLIFYLSIIITSFGLLLIFRKSFEIPWFVIRVLIGIIQLSIAYFCFHIPRLHKGMTFLYNLPLGNLGFTICFIILVLYIMTDTLQNRTKLIIIIFFLLSLLLGFFLFYWWNYHITQTYRKYLKKNEIDSLNLLLEEKNQEILYLRSENDKLARIIHKDNKLIPALSMAILDSHENNTRPDLSKLDSDSSLHMKLKQLYEERIEILDNYQKEAEQLPQTSYASVNAVLSYMQTEALKHKISYQVMLFDDLTSTIPDKISENDFVHMISDLLANAINACKDSDFGILQIFLGKIDGISTIKIHNNGNIFDMKTLKNLGQTRHTTHADTGGSGIGLMDIWMLKEKYKSTLLIDEITDSSSVTYTCINILFNRKNHYIIQSDRHKELCADIVRPDIMILSKE